METEIIEYIENNTSFRREVEIFTDPNATKAKNIIVIKVIHATTPFGSLNARNVTIYIHHLDPVESLNNANTILAALNEKRGIDENSWGVIGDIVIRYEGVDSMKRTVHSVLFKIGLQED